MRDIKLFMFLGLMFMVSACATPREGTPTGQLLRCPDGNRPLMDCRMAFEQYKNVIKLDLNVIQSGSGGIGLGAQPLINLDSITGDLLAHQQEVCIEYNNCMITQAEYVAEQRYLRRAQMKIREIANTAKIGIDPALAPPPPPAQPQEATNIPAPEVKVDTSSSTPGIFQELNNLSNKMQALAQQKGTGVTAPPPTTEEVKTDKKVSIYYSLNVRRPKTRPVTQNTEFDPVTFGPGVILKTGDQFKVHFRTDNDGYVYVITYDASGKAQILFPHPKAGAENFVKGGEAYQIPVATSSWYYLDEVTGQETLYVIASPFKIPNMDSLVADLQQGVSGSKATLTNARLRGSLEALTRGVGVTSDEKVVEPKVSRSTSITTERIDFLHQ